MIAAAFLRGEPCSGQTGEGCVTARCHQGLAEGKYRHPGLGECSRCHLAGTGHPDAVNATRLSLPVPGLCLSCHKELKAPAGVTMHEPFESGGCLKCHSHHASGYPWILKKAFAKGTYASWSESTYELCFSCHRMEMMMFPDTSYATGFRDGRKNLHFLHVRGEERGRSCTVCHDAHFTSGPFLVREDVDFGNWHMPIRFRPNPEGGSCSPGCHAGRSYRRAADPGSRWQDMKSVPVITRQEEGE